MKVSHFIFAILFTAVSGCASNQSLVAHLANCPKDYEPFVAGEATAEFVRSCMGKPIYEDHNPDGRFVYVYKSKEDTSRLTFLFDSSQKLLKVNGWKPAKQ